MKSKDFPDKAQGKVAPYGVYDLTANEGWVSVGITHDTAEFAVESIRRWWYRMGREVYPGPKELLVTADSGGSNGNRIRLWKVGLQRLADASGVRITVCHFPPGTSKWNKIEHRMFCHITENWRGRPLVSRAVVVNLIGGTRTGTGFRVQAELDTNRYEKGIKVTDDEMQSVQLEGPVPRRLELQHKTALRIVQLIGKVILDAMPSHSSFAWGSVLHAFSRANAGRFELI